MTGAGPARGKEGDTLRIRHGHGVIMSHNEIYMYIEREKIYILYVQEVVTLQKKYSNIFASEN